MANRILIDTNILLDYLLERSPFYEDSRTIILHCVNGDIEGCIAAHSISNMFFILRKNYSVVERKEILSNLCKIFSIEGIDKEKIISGLTNNDFQDFEDCLQMECAKSFGANYIITRNVLDYTDSEIPAITPKDYLSNPT